MVIPPSAVRLCSLTGLTLGKIKTIWRQSEDLVNIATGREIMPKSLGNVTYKKRLKEPALILPANRKCS